MPQLNIKEIALKAGVSVATVSRATNLHTAKFVKLSTRNKILNIVKQADYRPNPVARRLVTGKSNNIAVFLGTNFSSLFYSDYYMKILNGIVEILNNTDYQLMVRMVKNRERIFDFNEMIKGLDVAAAIVCNLETELEVSEEGIKDISIPAVILNMHGDNKNTFFIEFDQTKAAYNAVSYLLTLGHTKIAIINGPDSEKDAIKRYDGYISALRKNGIKTPGSYITNGQFMEDTGCKNVEALMRLKTPPTAIFCANDEIAIGALMRLKQLNVRCPEQVSIIGFDGIDAGRYMIPALTTMSAPIQLMANDAADRIVQKLKTNGKIEGAKMFDATLIEGGTCAKPLSQTESGMINRR